MSNTRLNVIQENCDKKKTYSNCQYYPITIYIFITKKINK